MLFRCWTRPPIIHIAHLHVHAASMSVELETIDYGYSDSMTQRSQSETYKKNP